MELMVANSDFTIADVLAWARTKPADERYDFIEAGECAIAQFGEATNRPHLVGLLSSELERLLGWDCVFALLKSRTFGELAISLEKLCPDTPVTKSDWLTTDAYLTGIEQVSA